jgi:hypothetical protein
MGQVVFDVLDCPDEWSARQAPKLVGNLRHLMTIAQTVEQQAWTRALQRHIPELAEEIGTAAAVDGDMGYVAQVNLGFF